MRLLLGVQGGGVAGGCEAAAADDDAVVVAVAVAAAAVAGEGGGVDPVVGEGGEGVGTQPAGRLNAPAAAGQ